LFLKKNIVGSSIDELFKTLYYLCQTTWVNLDKDMSLA
jgi:hypothetical protein